MWTPVMHIVLAGWREIYVRLVRVERRLIEIETLKSIILSYNVVPTHHIIKDV
jgi:hypothetical protein